MLVLALVCALALLPATAGAAAPPPPLTVVTFNLFHGGPFSGLTGDDGDLERRLQMAVEELRALAPDIVGLQEASVSRRRGNVAARLAEALGLHHVHAPSTRRVLGFPLLGRLLVWLLDFDEGPAILSRFPIAEWEIYDLPRCLRWLDPRVVLRATVVTPAGPLQVFSTHTSRAECQVTRVGEIVRAHQGALPAILTADLNVPPESEAVTALARQGLVDAFGTTRPGAPGSTVFQQIRSGLRTVTRRVDYVFARPGHERIVTVRRSRVILDAPRRIEGGHLWPSDHYGVVAELTLGPSPAPTARP
jgi:endonuclease/exonuclease/phosphatase family metal-dependent hydrolase